jgi:hypothetical protein
VQLLVRKLLAFLDVRISYSSLNWGGGLLLDFKEILIYGVNICIYICVYVCVCVCVESVLFIFYTK